MACEQIETAVVSKWSSGKGFGFAKSSQGAVFIHAANARQVVHCKVSGYRLQPRNRGGIFLAIGESIAIFGREYREGKPEPSAIAWSLLSEFEASQAWYAVYCVETSEVASPPVCVDRCFRETVTKTIKESVVFVGSEDSCRNYIKILPADLSRRCRVKPIGTWVENFDVTQSALSLPRRLSIG